MRSLDSAREACEKQHPGLLKAVMEISLPEREAPDSPVIEMFRSHGGPALLVPGQYGGMGVDPLTAVRVTRAIGSCSPSLGVAATMHHFTIAMLFALARTASRLTPQQLATVSRIAPERLLVASGWAEGKANQNILVPAMTATETDGGYLVNGVKRPCSLSASMDLLTASVALPGDGDPSLAMLLIPAGSTGISVRPFWASDVLAGAQSHEVRLTDVYVPSDLVVRTAPDDPHRLDDLQQAGFVWFEMLVTAAYTGVASVLVERVLASGRGSVTDRAALAVQLESAVALVEGVARVVADDIVGDESVVRVLVARYATQELLTDVAARATELLGGINFIQSRDTAYLACAVRPLAFHPPSRAAAAEPLVDYFAGGPLQLA